MTRRLVFLFSSFMILSTLPALAQSKQWLHVRVTDAGEGGDNVKVNVPLSLVETVLPMIEAQGLRAGQLNLENHLKDHKINVADLRKIWTELKSQGDFQFVSVESGDTDVRASLEGEFLIVRTSEDSEKTVDVQVPVRVVDALLSGPEDQLNIAAAVKALGETGGGEIVRIQDGDSHVRVWIDEDSQGQ